MLLFREELPKIEKWGAAVGAVLVINNISFLPSIGAAYYAVMALALLALLSKTSKVHTSGVMLWLYLSCLLSIAVNDVPAVFSPYARFGTFLLMTLLLSPFLVSTTFTRFRMQAFVTVMVLLQYVIAGSVVFGVLGLGYDHKYFQGITGHSMMLGPFAALATLFCLYQLLGQSLNRKKKYLYVALILGSLFCLLQAASRTAFLGCLISVLVLLGTYYRSNLGRYLKILSGGLLLLAVTSPLWMRYTDKLVEKNQGDTTELSIGSREEHWRQRIEEFRSSPIVGIGFASVDISGDGGSTFNDSGQVETGSSWLSSLSMTGLFDFAGLAFIFIGGLVRSWRLWGQTPLLSGFLIAIQCFWMMHMAAEGYIFAGGNSLFFCVWLLLGLVYGISRDKQLAYELQRKLYQ